MNNLNAEQIRQPISDAPCSRLDYLEVFSEIESTNSYLLEKPAPLPGRFRVAIAEHQTAGRGRMDRQWYSPPLSGLCMSMSYTFEDVPKFLPAATLAIGVGVAELLEQLGIRGVGLKWPNDLIVRNGKLGGILTEVRPGDGPEMTVVVGIGINVDLGQSADTGGIKTRIGYASDLASCTDQLLSRSALSAALVETLFNTLVEFETDGFERFFNAWERYDWLRGQRISVELPNRRPHGVCQGIDSDGALMLRTESGTERIMSGSIHLHGRQGDS